MRNRPLGMNLRNFLIKRMNPEQDMYLANDKESFKQLLNSYGIRTSRTYFLIRRISDIHNVESFPSSFVIKPNRGSGGKGILILKKHGRIFVSPIEEEIDLHHVKIHIEKILDGQFSEYAEHGIVLVEQRIYPSEKLKFTFPVGVPDIRVFCCNFKAVMAMIRYPTKESDGKANLSAGALGLGLNIASGKVISVYSKAKKDYLNLDDFKISPGYVVPKWNEIKVIAERVSRISGLQLCGVDLVLDQQDSILVLEANGYPGLEIQNVNNSSLLGPVPWF